MIHRGLSDKEQSCLYNFFIGTIIFFFLIAFITTSPIELLNGLKSILISKDALMTDYFLLANYGAAFLNSCIIMILILCIIKIMDIKITGMTIAVFFINAGFALFGKNILTMIPILFGTYCYANMQGVNFKRYIYTGLFGSCMAPFVTEFVYILPFHGIINVIMAVMLGIVIGFVLPPLAMHTASMHMGYNLFNVGFAAGLFAFLIVSTWSAIGIELQNTFIWTEGRPVWFICTLYGYFVIVFLYGAYINSWKIKDVLRITKHPGKAICDFILMDGVGSTFMNMAIVGIFILSYILIIKGDLSGPIVGAIFTIFGFSAFGVHLKNYYPCLIGIFLATIFTIYDSNMPSMQLAAIFCASLAPIAGQFGVLAGIFAGVFHAAIVVVTPDLYAGLNLYNNGFSAGIVAIILVPIIESFKNKY
ncbi:MAG: DUF1576 domain-containing protein [Lachnospiraceae bacterium]